MIVYTPEWINLSSSLPLKISLSSMPDSFVIKVEDAESGSTIYSTVLCAYSGFAGFYGIRDVVESYMESKGFVKRQFKLAIYNDSNEVSESKTFDVLYSKIRPMAWSDDTVFVQKSFLTTRSHYVIPRGGSITLYYIENASVGSIAIQWDCMLRKNDGTGLRKCSKKQTATLSGSGALIGSITIDYASLLESIEDSFSISGYDMLSVTLTVGDRSITVYYTDRVPDVMLNFRTVFNTLETVYIWGTTTLKTSLDHNEAVCNGVSTWYNQTVERMREVEFVPLSLEEADYVNQMLQSHYISYRIDDTREEQVFIDDITSEISDSPEETNKIKFSWRFADNSHWQGYSNPVQLFDGTYTRTFQ